MKSSLAHWLSFPALLMAVVVAFTAGCTAKDDRLDPNRPLDYSKSDEQLQLEAARFYVEARKALENQDYGRAERVYSFIAQRYPFTTFGTQSELDLIYVLYRSYEPDRALSAAERFLREHPRHLRADYVQYLKGLINSDRSSGFLTRLITNDFEFDMAYERQAFDDFSLLLRRFPQSPYVGDARNRMIFLRNRLAEHDYAIADFYYGRGAYVATAERCVNILQLYPGSPTSYKCLPLMEKSYRRLGLDAQADDAERMMTAQAISPDQAAAHPVYQPNSGRPGFWSRIGHSLSFGLLGGDEPPPASPPAIS